MNDDRNWPNLSELRGLEWFSHRYIPIMSQFNASITCSDKLDKRQQFGLAAPTKYNEKWRPATT